MASQEKIRLEVELGLEQAQKQAAALQTLLTKNIQPDSSAFKGVNEQISAAIKLANRLRGSLDTAFKTSSSSNKFLNDMEKLFNMLSTVTNQFNYFKDKDLIQFNGEGNEQLKALRTNLKATEEAIKRLQSQKIGTVFNGDSKELENVRVVANNLKKDLSKMTFDEFSTHIAQAMTEAKAKTEAAKKAVEDFQNLTNEVRMGNIAQVVKDLNEAVNNAGGGIKKTLTQDSAVDVKKKIKELYEQNGLSATTKQGKDVTAKIGAGSEFAQTIDEQTQQIDKALENQKTVIETKRQALQAAKAAIETVMSKKTFTTEDGTALKTVEEKANYIKEKILNQFSNIDFGEEFKKGSGLTHWSKGLEATLDEEISKLDINTIREKMVKELQTLFDSAAFDSVASNTNNGLSKIKQAVQNFFQGKGIDISSKDNPIKKVLDSLATGYNIDNFVGSLQKALEQLVNSSETELEQLNNNVQTSEQAYNDLKTAKETVDRAKSHNAEELKKNQEAAEGYRSSISGLMAELLKYLAAEAQNTKTNEGETKYHRAAEAVREYGRSLQNLESKQKALTNVQSAVTRWMGFYQVLNLTKKAINDMKKHIQELDEVMVKIAVVTHMSQDDLWKQIGQYSEIARQYGVAIKGVYEVSQLYYQQGLDKNDVMGLTTETLKMARIAGIDYATAADYMTTAVRGFKLEMEDAGHVTDVFSNLAAHTASSTEELATAISKTAASAASVGASFESTSAMMSTMIAATRESATNIGTALKSIISRYGELKQNMIGTDAEGEAYSLNKVDTALQSVGISIHDAAGQFRDFDDVILELANSWSTIDKNTQRYIATVMAGNRQQSRFLALVSNVEEYKRALELANDAENAGDIQTLKTLDSIDAKIERMKVTIQEFYTSSGLQDLYKGILDTITNVISGANALPKVFGKIPLLALTVGAQIINIVKNVAKLAIQSIQAHIQTLKGSTTSVLGGLIQIFSQKGTECGKAMTDSVNKELNNIGSNLSTKGQIGILLAQRVGAAASLFGSTLSLAATSAYGASTSSKQDQAAAGTMFGAAALTAGGSALSGAATGFATAGPIGAIAGGVMGLVSGLPSLISAINMNNVTLKREIELNQKSLQEAKQTETTAKGKENELESARDKLAELEAASNNSAESLAEYQEYMNQLAESYPHLISSIDVLGNKTIELTSLEEALAQARLDTAKATLEATQKELKDKELQKQNYEELQKKVQQVQQTEGYNVNKNQDLYKLVFNTDMEFERNPYEKLINEYNKWADSVGKEIVDLTPIGYATKNDMAKSWMTNNRKAIEEYYEAILKTYDFIGEENLGNKQKDILNSERQDLARRYTEILKTAQEAAEQAGNPLDLDYLVGEDIESLDDIGKWSYTKIKDSMEKTNTRIAEYINSIDNTINGVEDILASAAVNLGVQHNINTITNIEDMNTIQKYSTLMNSMLNGRYKGYRDWNNAGNQKIISELRDWILENQEIADQLMSIDYSQFSEFENIDFGDLSELPGWEEYVNKSFKKQFYQIRTRAVKNFGKQLSDMDLDSAQFTELLTGDNSLISDLIPTLRSGLVQYQKLKKDNLSSIADNYLTSLTNVYTAISRLDTDEQQSEIASVVKNIDFSDVDSIDSAVESLKNIDPDLYGDIINQLNLASQRLVINIEAHVAQIRDGAQEMIKNTEKVLDNVGKGVKLSEALENFDTIISTAEDGAKYNFDSIYEWSDAVDGYILSTTGISLWIKNTTKESTDKINELSKQLDETSTLYSGFSLDKFVAESTNDNDRKNYIKSILRNSFYNQINEKGEYIVSDEEIDAKASAYLAQYETLWDEWNDAVKQGETQTWSQWLDSKKQTLDTMTQAQIDFLSNLPKNSILTKITSLDFEAVAEGTGDSYKSSLQTLLQEFLGEAYEQISFEDIWNELLKGKFTLLNNALKLGGSSRTISKKTQNAAVKAEVKQYQEGIEELLTKSSNAVLSDETKKLLSENGIDIGTTSRTKAAEQLVEKLRSLLNAGEITIEEYNNSIDQYLSKTQSLGKEKALTDMFKNGFTYNGIKSFADTYQIELTNFFDKSTGQLTSDMAEIFDYDINTGELKIRAGQNFSDVMRVVNKLFGTGIKETSQAYKDSYSATIDKQIQDNDAQNKNKTTANQLQTLATASIGTTVNISAIDNNIKQQLGLTGDTYTVVSQAARDNIIAQIDQALIDAQDDPTLKATLTTLKRQIDSTRNVYKATTNVVSRNVTKDAAQALVIALGQTDTSDQGIENYMRTLGFKWNAWTEQFETDAETLGRLRTRINNLKSTDTTGEHTKEINQLEATYTQLEAELNYDISSVIDNITSNYKTISIDMITSLANALNKTFNEVKDLFISNGDGTYRADLSQIQALATEHQNELSKTTIDNIQNIITENYDNILASFNKATTFVSKGTTSTTEMQSFAREMSELVGYEYDADQLFNYDSELNVFKLNTDSMTLYAQKQKEELQKLGLSGQAINDYIRNQTIELLQENINVKDFLTATDETSKTKAGQALVQTIKDWMVSQDYTEKAALEYAASMIDKLNRGGEDAIDAVKELKGEQATTEEIAAAYAAAMTPLRTAADDLTKGIGDTVSGISIGILRAAGFALDDLGDGTAIITAVSKSTSDMVAAYLAIYNTMVNTAGHTQADLNNTYAKLLTANSQQRIDTLETLENASSMTYDAFAELLTKYSKDYKEMLATGYVEDTGFGNIRITDFQNFARLMNWRIDSPEYMEAYSNWVDSMIETRNNTIQSVFQDSVMAELNSIMEAKVGQSVNVSYLSQTFSRIAKNFNSFVANYGASVSNGILTLEEGTDIPGLIQAVADEAAKAGALIPDQLAELTDSIAKMLADIANLITGGISGSLSNADVQKLQNFATEQGLGELNFTRTADGLKLSNDEAIKLYNTIKDLDALQGEVVFDALKDNLIATRDEFKSVQATAQYTTELTNKLRANEHSFQQTAGNVDLISHAKNKILGSSMIKAGWTDFNENDYATLFSSTYNGEEFDTNVVLNITPITNDGKTILGPDDLDKYVAELMESSSSAEEILINDTRHLVMGALDVDVADAGTLAEGIKTAADEADRLHLESDAIVKNMSEWDSPSNARITQYKQELALVQKIDNIRASSKDDSFSFMDNEIPAGQNNPLNYWKNWVEAFNVISDATGGTDKGYMAYQDFYNIVTEMGNLAEYLGNDGINFGGRILHSAEEAANLITEAAGALSATDTGDIKVKLSDISVDFETGAAEMNTNVNKGIHSLAKSQVDMLDSMIKMLEVIVAMEKLGDIDANGSGSLELGEIFKVDVEGNPITNLEGFEQYQEDFRTAAKRILDFSEETGNDGLKDALNSIRINGYTLGEMFQDAVEHGVKKINIGAEAYTAAMNALYQAMLSDDYDLDNIGESLYKILEQSGLTNAEIDVGDKTFYIRSGTTAVIDWSNKDAVEAGSKAINQWINDNKSYFSKDWLEKDTSVKEKVSELEKLMSGTTLTSEARADIDFMMKIFQGDVIITDDKDHKGQYVGTYKGQAIHGSEEDVKKAIKRAMELESGGYNFEFTDEGRVVGHLNIGSATIEVHKDSNDNDKFIVKAPNGGSKTCDTKDEALGWLAMQGFGEQGTYTYRGATYNVFVDASTGLSYSISSINDKYLCDGYEFNTWQQLQEYFAFREMGKGGSRTYDKKTNIETIVKGNAVITYDHKTGNIKYNWTDPQGGTHEFPDKATYEAYITAYEQSGGQINSDGDILYEVNGANVSVNYNPGTGELTYTAQLANGKTVIAHDEDSLMFGIAAESELKGGTVTGNSKKTYSYIVQSGNVSVAVTVDENGKVTTTGDGVSSLSESIEKEVKENAEAKIKEDKVALDTPINATANAINIESSEDATGTLTSLPTEITYDGDVPIVASSVKIALAANTIPDVTGVAQAIVTALEEAINGSTINANPNITYGGGTTEEGGTGGKIETKAITAVAEAINSITSNEVSTVSDAIQKINATQAKDAKTALNEINATEAGNAQTAINSINSTAASTAQMAINTINAGGAESARMAINSINPGAAQAVAKTLNNLTAHIRSTSTLLNANVKLSVYKAQAAGNMGALAQGNTALASGTKSTLMGELGPELVVSHGRYFIVGQSGAEFVNLAADAIVFNHLQTQRLMQQGAINGRGQPTVSEQAAVSYAKGNVEGPAKAAENQGSRVKWGIVNYGWNSSFQKTQEVNFGSVSVGTSAARGLMGPAMASASAALTELKRLKAMWESLMNMSAQDFAGKGGGGGGGGGKDDQFIKDLEKWYNWLQRIAQLEKEINYQEAIRNRIQSQSNKNGYDYYNSQQASLEKLQEEAAIHRDLAESQAKYFDKRRKALNDQKGFSTLYQINKDGQLVYNSDKVKWYDENGKAGKATTAYEFLANLAGTDTTTGKPKYSSETQYRILKANGLLTPDKDGNYYDKSGKKIEADDFTSIVQAFWDKIDSDKEEMQGLHDSIVEQQQAFQEAEQKRNEILRAIEDNQRSLEETILEAVEQARQRAIDEKQDLRDVYEKTSDRFINGLTDALNREKQIYSNDKSAEDLEKKRRRLAILQRTGGSGAEIANLERDIESSASDLYFERQQAEIDAIQAATDAQLEKMDQEIDILQETLDYEKEHGLLWDEVSQVMGRSAEQIVDFLQNNNSEWWEKSPLAMKQDLGDALFEAEQWKAYQQDISKAAEDVIQYINQVEDPKSEGGKAGEPSEKEIQPKKENAGSGDTGHNTITSTSQYALTGKDKKTYYFGSEEEAQEYAKANWKWSKKTTAKHLKELSAAKYYIWAHKSGYSEGDDVEPEHFGPFTLEYAKAESQRMANSNEYNPDYIAITTSGNEKPYKGKKTNKQGKKVSVNEWKSKHYTSKKFREGGLADYTGAAILHGSKDHPEAVLNAHQTEILRNDILSNKPNSLLNLLSEFQATAAKTANASTYSSIDRSKSTSIGSISLNMNVKEIANDYDAKRAGEQAMEAMLRIARKSTTASVRG